jgi:putative intracellular protease/amidase
MFAPDRHLRIGSLLFPDVDQIDLTGPYEVLAAIPNATVHVAAKHMAVVHDFHGLPLYPTTTLNDMPNLDILHIPGGPGQEALMEDEETLDFIRRRAAEATHVLSVCTGALLLGAAGLLRQRRATTHWAAMEVLPYFGALVANARAAGAIRADVTGTDVFLLMCAPVHVMDGVPNPPPDLWRRYLTIIFDGLRPEGASTLPLPEPELS